jgi:hypothetical protein
MLHRSLIVLLDNALRMRSKTGGMFACRRDCLLNPQRVVAGAKRPATTAGLTSVAVFCGV